MILNRLLHPPLPSPPSTDPSSPSFPSSLPPVTPSSSLLVHPSESPSEASSAPHKTRTLSVDNSELEFEFLAESSSDGGDENAGPSSSLQATSLSTARDKSASGTSDEDSKQKKVVQTWIDDTGKRFRVKVRGEGLMSPEDEDRQDEDELEAEIRARRPTSVRKATKESVAIRGGFMAEYEIGGE